MSGLPFRHQPVRFDKWPFLRILDLQYLLAFDQKSRALPKLGLIWQKQAEQDAHRKLGILDLACLGLG